MLASLNTRTALNSIEARQQLHEWRINTLRLFLILAAGGYLSWQFSRTFPDTQALAQSFSAGPPIVATLLGTYALLRQRRRAAAVLFVCGGLVAVSWAIYVLHAPEAAILYPPLALVAAFVIHPLAGFVTDGAAIALLALLALVMPGEVTPETLWQTAISSGLIVVGVWALMHHLFMALNWYVASYAEAECRIHEAREHRAQLVQAYKQLDTAYYRIERASAALQLAWKAADEAERSKMELAVNISHELRTPLNLIAGYSELMMTSPASYNGVALPPAYRGDLSAIYRGAQHLLELTDDVLDLARMEIGRLGLSREATDVHQIVREAAGLIHDYVESKGLTFGIEIPEAPLVLVLDRLRIRQVLLNLLANAARITERGEIRVKVCHRPNDVQILVADTGPGIAPDDLSGIFQRFSTLDQPRTNWHSGTGLGLSISKRFVELHGGEMGVESTVGSGTTFWFTLPRDTTTAGRIEQTTVLARALHLAGPEHVVVLAHPDRWFAHRLERQLEGIRVEVAANAAEAVVRAHDLKASAVVTSSSTPIDAATCAVPVVSCPLPHPGQLRERLGVDDYLVKPVERGVLLEAIRGLGRAIQRILIVDDDTRLVRMLQRMLTSDQADFLIETAHNGEEALEKMCAHPPDLLLLDLAMPELDGVGVLRRMAAAPMLRDVKTIIISAHGDEEDTVPFGTEIHLSKGDGFGIAELTAIIHATATAVSPSQLLVDGTVPAPSAERPG